MAEGILKGAETGSATWLTIKAFIEGRINHLQEQLEADQPESSTYRIRGQIKELRELITRCEGRGDLNTGDPKKRNPQAVGGTTRGRA